jgi:hypothetical protein
MGAAAAAALRQANDCREAVVSVGAACCAAKASSSACQSKCQSKCRRTISLCDEAVQLGLVAQHRGLQLLDCHQLALTALLP